MLNDRHNMSDKPKPKIDKEISSKARENIMKLTDSIEREAPKIQFSSKMDKNSYAKYKDNAILISEDCRNLTEQEPALMEPLLAHERVHALYQGDDPVDEASLQAYVDEELAAYQAEYETWMKIKDDINRKYPTRDEQAQLGEAGRNLLSKYKADLELQVQEQGWDGFRVGLERIYRKRMEAKK